jgi:hypothetical protein
MNQIMNGAGFTSLNKINSSREVAKQNALAIEKAQVEHDATIQALQSQLAKAVKQKEWEIAVRTLHLYVMLVRCVCQLYHKCSYA